MRRRPGTECSSVLSGNQRIHERVRCVGRLNAWVGACCGDLRCPGRNLQLWLTASGRHITGAARDAATTSSDTGGLVTEINASKPERKSPAQAR